MVILLAVAISILATSCGNYETPDKADHWPAHSVTYNNITYYITNTEDERPVGLLYKVVSGESQQITVDLDTGAFFAIDIDQDHIYVACRNGIIVSKDLDGDFSWSLHWGWDACIDIDMNDGVGWALITSWGSMSGPIQITPDTGKWKLHRGDLPWSRVGRLSWIEADPAHPLSTAAVGEDPTSDKGYRTTDGGEYWRQLSEY